MSRCNPIVALVVAIASGCAVNNPVGDDVISGQWELVEIDGAAPAVPVMLTIDNGAAASVEAATDCREIFGSLTVVETSATAGDATFTMPGWSPGVCDSTDDAMMAAVRDALERSRVWSVADQADGQLQLGPDGATASLTLQNLD